VFNSPAGLAVDVADGSVLVADEYNNRVCRVSPNGTVSVVGGVDLVTDAFTTEFRSPGDVAVNVTDGTVLVADTGWNRVRKLWRNGSISTVAGTGSRGFDGDGAVATAALLSYPQGIALNNADGSLLIADTGNKRVRRVWPNETISTAALLSSPYAVAFNATDGSWLIADRGDRCVRAVWPDGTISTVAGNGTSPAPGDGGLARGSVLNLPTDVAVDLSSGRLFIADVGSWRVRIVFPNGTIGSLAGGGPFSAPVDGGSPSEVIIARGVAVHPYDGSILVADTRNNAVRRIWLNGTATVVARSIVLYSGDGGPATAAALNNPSGVAVAAADGSLLVADQYNNRIRRVWPNGTVTTVTGSGVPGFSGDDGPGAAASLFSPSAVALHPSDGSLLIADEDNHRVRRVWPNGTITTVAGSGVPGFSGDGGRAVAAALHGPTDVTVNASDGSILIADRWNNRIRRVWPNGTIVTVAGSGASKFSGDGGPSMAAALSGPSGVSLHPTDGSLLIADQYNHRIRRVWPNGTIDTVAGTGSLGFSGDGGPGVAAQLSSPSSVVASPLDGSLFIADLGNSRIRRIWPNGTITTFVGTWLSGYGGDNGPPTEARLQKPAGVAVHPLDGALLIADTGNHRIRRVSLGALASPSCSVLPCPTSLASSSPASKPPTTPLAESASLTASPSSGMGAGSVTASATASPSVGAGEGSLTTSLTASPSIGVSVSSSSTSATAWAFATASPSGLQPFVTITSSAAGTSNATAASIAPQPGVQDRSAFGAATPAVWTAVSVAAAVVAAMCTCAAVFAHAACRSMRRNRRFQERRLATVLAADRLLQLQAAAQHAAGTGAEAGAKSAHRMSEHGSIAVVDSLSALAHALRPTTRGLALAQAASDRSIHSVTTAASALAPELQRLAAANSSSAPVLIPGAAATPEVITERRSWAAAEMASRLLSALPSAALQAAAQTVLVAATSALSDAGAAAETQQTAALKRKSLLRRAQQSNSAAGSTARRSLDRPVSDLHAGVVDLAVGALIQEWGLARTVNGRKAGHGGDGGNVRMTVLPPAARASLVAAGPLALRFLNAYYRGAAAEDAAAPDAATVPLCALLPNAGKGEAIASRRGSQQRRQAVELTSSRLRDRAAAVAMMRSPRDLSSVEAKATPAQAQLTPASGSYASVAADEEVGNDEEWGSFEVNDAELDDELDQVVASEQQCDASELPDAAIELAAVSESRASSLAARTLGRSAAEVRVISVDARAARRQADTSTAVARPVAAERRHEARMLKASIEALAVLSLQAGARAVSTFFVEQLSEADEEVAVQLTHAAASRGPSSAAAVASPQAQAAAGASRVAEPMPSAAVLSLPQPPPHKLTLPATPGVEVAYGRGARYLSGSQLPCIGHSTLHSALSLPTRAIAAPARSSPPNYDDAALAAIAATLGTLSSVRAQQRSKAMVLAWQEAKTALGSLLACGVVVSRWAMQRRPAGQRQQPFSAQLGQREISGQPRKMRPLKSGLGQKRFTPSTPLHSSSRGKIAHVSESCGSACGIELRTSPLLAHVAAKRLAAAQAQLTGRPLNAPALGRRVAPFPHPTRQQPVSAARSHLPAADGSVRTVHAAALNVAHISDLSRPATGPPDGCSACECLPPPPAASRPFE
jgi:sugar lactone lactonase YvrE